jgi:hypothetical protein
MLELKVGNKCAMKRAYGEWEEESHEPVMEGENPLEVHLRGGIGCYQIIGRVCVRCGCIYVGSKSSVERIEIDEG